MEQVTGIEPVNCAWEAHILPLNYTCVYKKYITTNNFRQQKQTIKKNHIFIICFHTNIGEVNMVKFIDETSCFIGESVSFGENVVIYENNHITGNVSIGDNSIILPGNFIENTKIGKNCRIHNSVIEESVIENNVSIGPFARIRPNSKIDDNAKIGNFVEIKNSRIGKNSKISHLAYVGDASIGEDCNIGCGVIFANYNGKTKNHTTVQNHVFIGSNCNIIAPVNIEKDSYICAGTTVTEDVKCGDMVIGRSRQEIKPNKAKKYW